MKNLEQLKHFLVACSYVTDKFTLFRDETFTTYFPIPDIYLKVTLKYPKLPNKRGGGQYKFIPPWETVHQ